MKKLLLSLFILAFLFIAAGNSYGQTTVREQEQQRLRVSPAATGVQARNESQVQIQNSEREGPEDDETSESAKAAKPINERSETAREHMSIVAQMVEEILASRTIKGGIGEQIREIAQLQNKAQEQIESQVEKLDSRPGWLKSVLGPDRKAVNNLKQEVVQNQVRVRQLEQIKTELENQEDISQIQEMINALVQENTALGEKLSLEESRSGILGWILGLFVK